MRSSWVKVDHRSIHPVERPFTNSRYQYRYLQKTWHFQRGGLSGQNWFFLKNFFTTWFLTPETLSKRGFSAFFYFRDPSRISPFNIKILISFVHAACLMHFVYSMEIIGPKVRLIGKNCNFVHDHPYLYSIN